MYGIIDEEGILGEDEVFINLPSRTLAGRQVLIMRYLALLFCILFCSNISGKGIVTFDRR